MALVPHKITALAESDAQGTDGKNIVAGAVVSLYDTNGAAVTLFDDAAGGNGSTAKTTDSEGAVVVYVNPGIYSEEINGGLRRSITVADNSLRSQLADADSDVLVGGVEVKGIASAISKVLNLGTQSVTAPASTSYLRVDDGSLEGLVIYPFENSFSSLAHNVTNIQENSFGGYDVSTDQGVFEFVSLQNLDYRRDLDARGWGLTPEDKALVPTVNQTTRILKIRDYIKDNFVVIKVPSGNYLCDGDALDFRDCTVGGFLGAGVDKTTFYAATDNTTTAWFNLGTDGGPFEPTTSDVQFGDYGGFSLRCNGRNISKACSHNFFRRGSDRDVRVYDAATSFSYDYGWLNTFGPLRSQNHKSTGHRFGGSSLNAVTFTNLEASSNVPNVRDYSFENPNTVLLISPDAEGAGGGFYFEDGRSVTLLNLHSEAENTKLRTMSSSTNGLCINVIGGAAFNAPAFFALPDAIQALTVTNFCLYDVGSDFSGVLWQINAKNVIVNNLNVVDSNKNKASRKQVRTWLLSSLGTNVEFCSLDGEILRSNGVNTLVNESDRYFSVITTPSTPVDIATAVDIERTTAEITISQRLNASQDAAVRILATVSSDGTFTQSEIASVNNGPAGIALGYNNSSKRFTVDSSFGVSTKIKIEYWRN